MIPLRIIVHCSATKDSKTVSWGAMRKWHMGLHPDSPYKNDPWKDIGYHFGIELIGDRLEILMGRMPHEQGAHCRGHNVGSIGICIVGNYDVDIFTEDHERLFVQLLHWLMLTYGIAFTELYGHRDFDSSKSCPGENVYRFLKDLRKNF